VSFAIGDLIEKGGINAMSFGESHLISLHLQMAAKTGERSRQKVN